MVRDGAVTVSLSAQFAGRNMKPRAPEADIAYEHWCARRGEAVPRETAPPTSSDMARLRDAIKAAVTALATLAITPVLVSYGLRSLMFGRDRALEGSSQALSLIPGVCGQYIRRAFYALVLAHCDRSATIEFGVLFSKAGARVDEGVYVGPRCHLGLVHLERDVLLGPAVQVPSGPATHGTSDPGRTIRDQAGVRTLIRIGAGSWIGAGSIVMADVGPASVVGAGSVVTRAVPPRVLAAGVPAVVKKPR